MKKIVVSIMAAIMATFMFAAVALAAISEDQAKDIVIKKYPQAEIYKVKDKDDQYSVTFHTPEHPNAHVKMYIDKESGEVLGEKVKED